MKKGVLLIAGVGALALLLQPRPRARKKDASRPAARWEAQLAPFRDSTGWKSAAPSWAIPIVEQASRASGIPASFLAAVIRTESAWQPYVISAAGAIGLMQLMPATAAELGVDPFHPGENVLGGSRYLRQQLDAFDDLSLALAAYNAGPHRVRQYGGVPPYRETQAYVARILERLGA